VVARFPLYDRRDEVRAPLASLLYVKIVEWKKLQESQKVAKWPNDNFGSKRFSK